MSTMQVIRMIKSICIEYKIEFVIYRVLKELLIICIMLRNALLETSLLVTSFVIIIASLVIKNVFNHNTVKPCHLSYVTKFLTKIFGDGYRLDKKVASFILWNCYVSLPRG